MLPIGPPELALILAAVILLVGASKIPELGRGLGEATMEFKRGQEVSEQELEDLRENN